MWGTKRSPRRSSLNRVSALLPLLHFFVAKLYFILFTNLHVLLLILNFVLERELSEASSRSREILKDEYGMIVNAQDVKLAGTNKQIILYPQNNTRNTFQFTRPTAEDGFSSENHTPVHRYQFQHNGRDFMTQIHTELSSPLRKQRSVEFPDQPDHSEFENENDETVESGYTLQDEDQNLFFVLFTTIMETITN